MGRVVLLCNIYYKYNGKMCVIDYEFDNFTFSFQLLLFN